MGSFAIEIAYTLLPPMLLALAVAGGCRLLLPKEASARWQLAAGAAAGMLLGYVLLPDWAPLAPDRHWHWLAYLSIAAAILGAAVAGRSTAAWERLLAIAVLAFVTALTLVPTWDTLNPPRRVLVPLVAGYVALIYALLAALPATLRGRNFALLLSLSAFGTAALVGYEVSVKFGQLGGTFAAALAGVAIWLLLMGRNNPAESTSNDGADGGLALAAVYACSVGGLAFVATIEPSVPATPLLLAPMGPWALWLFIAGPLSRRKPFFAGALQALAVLSILAAVAIWLYLRAAAETEEWSFKASTNHHASVPALLAGN